MIGLVTTSFPRFPEDHAGRFVAELALALARRGRRIEVIAPCDASSRTDDTWLPDGLTVRRVRYAWPRRLERLCYGAGAPENLKRRPWTLALAPGLVASLARTAADPRYRRLMSHWLVPSGFASGLVAGRRPHLAYAHSSDVHLLRRLPEAKAAAKFLVSTSTALGFSSPFLRDVFLDLLDPASREQASKKCRFLPVGIPDSAFDDPGDSDAIGWRRATRDRFGIEGYAILGMGRFVAIKGYDVLLDAAAAHLPDATVVLAGDGPLKASLQARALGLGVRARFPGMLADPDKGALFKACDLFAAPSRDLPDGSREGVPVSLLEAMASGLPVVASAAGGIPSAIANEVNGLLVPPEDPARLGEAMRRLRCNPDLSFRVAREGHALASRRRWGLLAADYDELLFA